MKIKNRVFITLLITLFSGMALNVPGFNKKIKLPRASKTSTSELLQKQIQKSDLPHYKIALLVPSWNPNIEARLKGFKNKLEQDARFTVEFCLFNSEGDRTRLRSMVEEIFMKDYDLVHSIGMEPTKMLKEVGEQRNEMTPIVFNSVKDPVTVGLVESEESSKNNLTGIASNFDYTLYVYSLLALQPHLNKVAIVYDPTQQGGRIEQAKQEVQRLLEVRNIEVCPVVVYNTEEIPQRVAPILQHDGNENIDAVLVLCDNTVLIGVQHLAKLCDTYGVPLVLPSLEYAQTGIAAICFSMFEYTIGSLAAAPVRQILEEGKHPSQIPIAGYGKKWQLLIHPHAMKQQKLKLDSTIEFLTRHTHVVKPCLKQLA